MKQIKLTRTERLALIKTGRRAGDFDSAVVAMETVLFDDVRFESFPATEISDYCWAAAAFCFPAEARNL